MTDPWRDPETLRSLYYHENHTAKEIGDRLGCSASTVRRWMEEFGLDRREPGAREERDRRYRDEEWLREQYVENERTVDGIADMCSVDHAAVSRWLSRAGIETRDPGAIEQRKASARPATFETTLSGYERWVIYGESGRHTIRVHRLLAAAEYGLNAIAGRDVHHKNGVPWDNRPENIEVLEHADHSRLHRQNERRRGLA